MTNSFNLPGQEGLVVTHADQGLLIDSLLHSRPVSLAASRKQETGTCEKSTATSLKRQTHLHLQSRNLVGYLAGDLFELVPNASAVFLQDNQLTHVPAISSLRNLTILYLQDNNLTSTEDLKHLTALRKLDLEGNALQSLSGLSSMVYLTDLHVSRQRLPPGASLHVDQEVLNALSASLMILRSASCNLQSVSCFSALQQLQVADFSYNELTREHDCFFFVESLPCLQRLDVRGNEICQVPRLMDQVVLRGEHLEEFNGKNVQPQTREFLIRKAKLRDQEKSKCSMDGHSAGQRTQNIVLGKGNSSIDVQEARPLRSSKFAQLRIPSSSGVAMSLTSRKGLASVCTPPNACTREDLKAAAQARS